MSLKAWLTEYDLRREAGEDPLSDDVDFADQLLTMVQTIANAEEFRGIWAVSVNIVHTTSDGYTGNRQVPTFFLQEAAQGFLTEEGAIKVAARIVDPIGYLDGNEDELHITAVKLT